MCLNTATVTATVAATATATATTTATAAAATTRNTITPLHDGPLYELVERYAARVAVLPGQHGVDDGQRLQLLPDHVRLEVQRPVGQRGPYAPDEVHAVPVLGRVGERPEYFHAARPVHGGRGARAPRLRVLAPRFGVVLLRKFTRVPV